MAQKSTSSTIEMEALNKAMEVIDHDALAPNLKALLTLFLNKIEEIEKTNKELRIENQKLRDENNRLKGEQGKPDIRPQTPSKDVSSEAERKTLKLEKIKKSKAKNHKIKVDRTVKCPVDKNQLPPDAIFKGYRPVVVQDILIQTDNV
jgi:hypothetical protein